MTRPVNPQAHDERMKCAFVHQDGARAGRQCGRSVAAGYTVCNFHGGANPAAKQAAERALAVARMPAIEALLMIVEQFLEVTCATCGYPRHDSDEQRVVVRAAQTILDRTGMGPHSTLEVKQSDGTMDLKHYSAEERAELAQIVGQLKHLKERVKQRINPGAPVLVAQPPQAM